MKYTGKLYGKIGRKYIPLKETTDDVERMREWIKLAAPMLSTASCIVIDEAIERLGEIAGCRGLLELCPVDFDEQEVLTNKRF